MVRYAHNGRFYAEHRAEDMVLIADVLCAHRAPVIVELGTYYGGFAAFLSDTSAPWGGVVHTFDIQRHFGSDLLAAYPNLVFREEDVLTENPTVAALVQSPGSALYCDNGNKEAEIACYAPHVPVGGLLGCHDYGTEVHSEVAEPLLAELGFVQHRHDEFAALANPVSYPHSMTRFWLRQHAPQIAQESRT